MRDLVTARVRSVHGDLGMCREERVSVHPATCQMVISPITINYEVVFPAHTNLSRDKPADDDFDNSGVQPWNRRYDSLLLPAEQQWCSDIFNPAKIPFYTANSIAQSVS